MFSELLHVFSRLPLFLLAAGAVYIPLYKLGIKKRLPEGRYTTPRHLVNGALGTYLAALIYMLLFMYAGGFWHREEALQYGPQLTPFVELLGAYSSGDGFWLSQYMLNIVLFVPFGLLLPLVFQKRMDRLWKVGLCALGTSLFFESIQFFIGRTADIDDVIANAVGGVLGYLLFYIFNAAFHKKAWWQRLYTGEARSRRPGAIAAVSVFLVLIAGTAALDMRHNAVPYGLLRVCEGGIPRGARLEIPLSDMEGELPLYRTVPGNAAALCGQAAALLGLEGELSTWRETATISSEEATLFAGSNGSWLYTWHRDDPEAVGQPLPEDAGAQIITSLLAPLLAEGETLRLDSARAGESEGELTLAFSPQAAEGTFLPGQSGVTATFLGERLVYLHYNLIRVQPEGRISAIPQAQALRYARRWGGVGWPRQSEIPPVAVCTVVYREGRAGLFVPYYHFQGQDEEGGVLWSALVDAVAR